MSYTTILKDRLVLHQKYNNLSKSPIPHVSAKILVNKINNAIQIKQQNKSQIKLENYQSLGR
jgi:hypothetical protein